MSDDLQLIDDLRDIYENAPCGYLTIREGRIFRANMTLASWLGTTAEELSGKRLHSLLSIPGRIFYETHVAPILRMQGHFSEFALDLATCGSQSVHVIANAIERRDGNGRPLFVRMVFFQAPERRSYEKGLVASLRTERMSAELREQFIAVLGHDLRNPLASLGSGARILASEPNRTEKETMVLEMMHSTIFRMAGMIEDVMDFARGRLGGGVTLNRAIEPSLEPILEQVVKELRFGKSNREIDAEYIMREPINCDRSRIGQLASNLLGNAVTHGAPNKPIRLFAKAVDGIFELSVTNGGEPIADLARDRLFQPFFRGEVRQSQQGLGLGLYIASQIAKAHGGTLEVSSTSEETKFTFRMPSSL
jgi:sigma-B regulation protein RsbU (phosphoserine phosphatase)